MENITVSSNKTPNNTINLREVVLKHLRKWYWFVISIFCCFAFAYLYLSVATPTYEVQAKILLRQDNSTKGFSEMAILESMGMSGSSKDVEDEIQVLTSKNIIQNVIEDLELETEYFEKKGLKFVENYPVTEVKLIVNKSFNRNLADLLELNLIPDQNGYKVKFKTGEYDEEYYIKNLNESIKTPIGVLAFKAINNKINTKSTYKIISYPIKNITENYSKSISVSSATKKSNAIVLSTITTNKEKAKTIINKLVELYNLDAVLDKNMIASSTKAFVDERLKLIKDELLNVELDVENYKKQNGLTNITSEAELFLRSSSEYRKKLAEIETQLNLVGYIESHVKDNKNQYSLIPANLGISDGSLIELTRSYNLALLERMKLMRTTNNDNPVITQAEQQLKTLRSSIIASIGSVKDGLLISKKDVLGKDAQFNSKIKQVPTQERQFIEIKRQQEIKQELYLFLLQKREENALTLASTIPSAKTLDSAYASIAPIAPKRLYIYAIAFILSIVLPVLLIYIIDLMNDKISDRKELLKLVKVPYLGSIGINKEADRVVVREGKTTPIVEMFRMIRTNLQFMLGSKKSPVILITSSIGGEGKSFTAINLAMSFALTSKKVILIGLDIRKPMLGDYMHISKNKGASLFLSDSSYQLKDIIIPSGIHPFLNVIPAGPIPPNPAELLMSNRLEEMIAELKLEYDYIIVDSAPVGLVSDTYLLNRVIDNAVYVSRQNYTPKEVTNLINEIHDNNKLNNIGLILNGVDEITAYGYGYGYGNKENNK